MRRVSSRNLFPGKNQVSDGATASHNWKGGKSKAPLSLSNSAPS